MKRDLAKTARVGPMHLRRPHRTCATYLRNEGVAQGQLRRSSVETTKRHYLKAIPAEQKARVEHLDREMFGAQKVVEMRTFEAASIAEIAGEVARGKIQRR